MINSLFDCSTDNIGLHLKNIFKSGELIEDSVTEKIPATAAEGKNYLTKSSTVRIRTFSFLSLIPQRFSVCGRMFWGRFNNCAWLRLAPYFPLLPHLFRKTETSDFFEANIRTFAQRSPMFCNFRTLLFCTFRTAIPLPPQKKFGLWVKMGVFQREKHPFVFL